MLKKTNNPLMKRESDSHINTLFFLMAIVLILMAIMKPGGFYSISNLRSMIFQFPEYGILCFGMMACMIAGGIDLSLVGIMNLAGVVAAEIMINLGGVDAPIWAIIVACIAAIAVGAACGAFNGFIIGWLQIPAMLVTLCGLELYTGLCVAITGGPALTGLPKAFKWICNGSVGPIPFVLFIFLIVLAIVVFIMKFTVFGKEIYFLGSNSKAAMYSGINTLRVTVMTYMFSGILGGVSGIVITSHLNSAKSSYGASYTLLSLLIVVLGGIHPDGGKGRVLGVALAIVLLQLIANAFTLMHAPDTMKTFTYGLLLVASLALDLILDKRAAKKAAAHS